MKSPFSLRRNGLQRRVSLAAFVTRPQAEHQIGATWVGFCPSNRRAVNCLPYNRQRHMGHLPPKQALQFLQTHPDALFIDCRSEMEYLFVGHPVGALHVPWNDGPDWSVNPGFVAQVQKLAARERPIVLICRSGNRSQEAGEALERAGYTQVFNVEHGFEGELDGRQHRNTRAGWRFEGLPWEQC
jgi:rhodanese-related sulfurtransferase